MIKVLLFQKIYIKPDEVERKYIDSKIYPKPNSYDDFFSSILKTFKIKENEISSLLAFTNEEDENPINNQQDLDDNKDETVEYRIILENKESLPSKPEKKKTKKEIKEKKDEKEEDKKDNKENSDPEEVQEDKSSKTDGIIDDIEIKIDINLDITDQEMENIIESQIKPIPEIQKDIYNDDLHLDIKEYKKGINNKYNNIINEFNKIYDNKMNNILIEKHKLLKEELNSKFTKFSNVNVNTIFEIKKDSEGLKEEFSERVLDINGMDDAILKMSKIFPGGEIKLPKKKKKIPKNEINDDEENDGEEKISVIFKDIEIKEEINLDQTKYIDIPIKIENVGDKMPEKLFYVKDEEESSKDIIFVSNRENIHQLSMTGNFNKNVQEVHSIYVRIKEPKPNQEYNLYLYVKNKMEGKNVSNKLKIVLKVKGEEKIEVEDPKKKLEEEAIKLYSELSEKYDLKIITTKEEAIKKFIEFENDNDKINKWINDEFNKKCDYIYEKLNISNIVEKDEAKNDFSRLKYDEAKIKEWAQSKIEQNNNNKAENLYKKLEAKFKNLNEIEKNEVIEKIKEENFNEENIIKWIEPQIKIESDPEPDPEPIPNPIPGPEDAKLDETVKKYEEAFSILSLVDEDDFKAKIKELNFDDEKITEWIEKTLSEEI